MFCKERKEERVSERALALRGHGPVDEPDFGRLPSGVWGKQVREIKWYRRSLTK